MRSFIKALFLTALTAVFFPACASGPVDVPADMPAAKIVQRAQEATDRNRYNQALRYYQIILERYPVDLNDQEHLELSVGAEYEIAFLHYKQKKYAEAKGEFTSLLEYYVTTDAELYPPQYRILAEKVLVRIEEKLIQQL
jgi:outer membrane protein assembly factor BamD (BamD/ComL family)